MTEPVYVHVPKNQQLSIDEVWLFISVDETGEGVCAVTVDGLSMPLIAADEARMKSLIPAARNIARASGRQVKLIKLSQRTELMSISPDGGDMQ